jgi:indole-3-glycerol phosphate synthase
MGFLEEIVRETRTVVARPDYLSGIPRPSPSVRARSLRQAVTGAGEAGAVLAEFKRVSPGAGNPDLAVRPVAEFVDVTTRGGVAAYSCIATEPRFRGSLRDVTALVQATDLPVLFKDFVVEVAQLDAAARAGASAVLLIARLETEGYLTTPLTTLATEAHVRHLEVLLEFHDRTELRQTAGVAADMYGVNVRNLDTLRMEPEVAEATIGAAQDHRPLLGLSGVASSADARRFWNAGVDGILVGSALARASDPAGFLRTLGRTNHGSAA